MKGPRAAAMFGAGRYSIPRPVTRNLEDLDSVQSVLLHRSVPAAGTRTGTGTGTGREVTSRARQAPAPLSPFVAEAGSSTGRGTFPSASPGSGRPGARLFPRGRRRGRTQVRAAQPA